MMRRHNKAGKLSLARPRRVTTRRVGERIPGATTIRAMKPCSQCRVVKPLQAFDHARRSRDGRHHRCKACDRRRDRERRQDGRMDRSINGWFARHPLAERAHKAVAKALKAGTLKKEPCCVCGSTHKLNAHHEDYTKPLEVMWHCRFHHVELHRLERLHGRGQILFQFMREETR